MFFFMSKVISLDGKVAFLEAFFIMHTVIQWSPNFYNEIGNHLVVGGLGQRQQCSPQDCAATRDRRWCFTASNTC